MRQKRIINERPIVFSHGFSFRAPMHEAEALIKRADKQRRSVSALLGEALTEYLQKGK